MRDAHGELATRPAPDDGGDFRVELDHAPAGGEVRVSYRVRAEPRDGSRYALRLSHDQLSAVGHTFLLLPKLDAPAPVHVRWHLGAMTSGAVGACTLGAGDDVTGTSTTEDLAHAVYVAGKLDFVDGGDGAWVSIVGPKSFEPSSAFQWTKTTFGLVRARPSIPDSGPEPFSFFFVAEPGLGAAHDGAAFGRSFAIWFDAGRTLDDPLKITVAHALLHRVFGAKVRLADEGGGEAAWFSEGFTVHYARKILFASKRISAEAFLDDVKRHEGEHDGAADAGAHAAARRSHASFARGALYAASLDAAVRHATKGARSLDDLVRELALRAEKRRSPMLPAGALRELAVREAGAAAGEEFDRVVVRGEEARPPSDAFGPCFERVPRELKVFDLGFDRAALDGFPGPVRGVEKDSAAERAGLRDGAFVTSAKVPPPDQKNAKVELTIQERKGTRKIRYKPEARRTESVWRVAPLHPLRQRAPSPQVVQAEFQLMLFQRTTRVTSWASRSVGTSQRSVMRRMTASGTRAARAALSAKSLGAPRLDM